MSAELLREAARLMRERAQAAEPGPWTAELPGQGFAWVNTPGYTHAWGMHGFHEEAEHVASWHPAVALAVADWLADVAELQEIAELNHDEVSGLDHALAVARAYLGGAS